MLDKYIDYTLYLLKNRRGIILTAQCEILLDAVKCEYNALDVSDYKAFVELDAKELKKYNLFIFRDAFKNLNKWSKKATQRLSRIPTRAKRFVFCGTYDKPVLETCYILSKCTERSVANLKTRFCEAEPQHDGSLKYSAYTMQERLAELQELLLDHTVDLAVLEAKFKDEEEHSRFGPSGLAHLSKCPGSLWIEEPFKRCEGAAMLGSMWHDRAERLLKTVEDVSQHAPIADYVNRARHMMVGCMNGIEEWHEDKKVHPEFSGTCDFYAYDPVNKWLYVMDYKNGKFPVKAENNTQLKAYACLIADKHKFKPKAVALAIAQRGRGIDIWDVDERDVLTKWRKELKDIIGRALEAEKDPYEHLNHKECWSSFCPARDIHKRAREVYVKEKERGASDAIARLRANKEARLVRNASDSGVPDTRVARKQS